MRTKILALSAAALFIAPQSFAAVLDEDSAVVSTNAGKFRDWSMTFFSIASVKNMNPGKTTDETRSVESYDYLSVNYKVDSVTRISLRLPFNFNTSGVNAYGDQRTSDFALSDIHFVYSNYDLGYVGDVDLSGKAKIYLPTGEASQSKKQIAKIRFEGYADYQIARKLSIAYIAKPDIYWQSQTASVNSTIPIGSNGMFVTDPRSTNKQFGLEHYAQLQWEINSIFSFTSRAGFDESWYHSSAAEELEGNHSTSLRVGMNLWIRPMRGLSFTLGVSNDTRLESYRGKDIAFVEPHNTQYSLMTNAYLF